MMHKQQESNARILQWVFLLGGLILTYQVAKIQLFDSSFREAASSATISKQVLHTSRGLIYDRDGNLLVFNEPIYDIQVTLNKLSPKMDTAFLLELLDMDRKSWEKAINKDWSSPRYAKYAPFTIQTKMSPEQYGIFEEHRHKFPGISAQRRHTRGYASPHAAQTLGFISEIDRQSLQRMPEIYQYGDIIGKYGLEKYYEDILRGEKGMSFVLKDKWGNTIGAFDGGRLDTPAVSGADLYLTLD
ncbi:MAG: hypothetical protein GVX96_01445, partial [Bacteroidetes bacterium]|nr:hypothetical protein [Bacteroidota bacterium]